MFPRTPALAIIVLAAATSVAPACAPSVTEGSHAPTATPAPQPAPTEVRASAPAPAPAARADAPPPEPGVIARVANVDAVAEADARSAVASAIEAVQRARRRGVTRATGPTVARREAELTAALVELASVLCAGVEPRRAEAGRIIEATEAVNEAQELVDADPARACRREGGDEADCEIVAAGYDQELTNAEERLAALERELDLAGLVAQCAPSDPDLVRGLR